MPIYEYICHACSNAFELIEPITAEAVRPCPTCGAQASRLISNCTFHLKGSGWYATDYARGRSGPNDRQQDGPVKEKTSSEESAAGPSDSAAADDQAGDQDA